MLLLLLNLLVVIEGEEMSKLFQQALEDVTWPICCLFTQFTRAASLGPQFLLRNPIRIIFYIYANSSHVSAEIM